MSYKFESYRYVNGDYQKENIDDFFQVSLSDLISDKDGEWEFLEYTQGSDYSGSSVERSNYEVIKEMLQSGELNEKDVKLVYGGANSYGILYRIGAFSNAPSLSDLNDEEFVEKFSQENNITFEEAEKKLVQAEQLKSTISGLENYHLIDENHLSSIEMEWQNEAWESWVESDFKKALLNHLVSNFEVETDTDEYQVEYLEDLIENLPEEKTYEIFNKLAERANEYWESQHSDMYIDVEEIAKTATMQDLMEAK